MPNYEKRGNTWRVRFNTYEGGREIRKSLSAPTKREAREAYEKYIKDYESRNASVDESVRTVRKLCEKYLEHQKDRVKETTFAMVSNLIEVRIIPMLGDIPVAELKPGTIDEWYASLNGLSPMYKKLLYSRLNTILNYGKRYHDLPNPMEKLDSPRGPGRTKKDMNVWTVDELNKFLSVIDDKTDRLYFKFLFFSGCRKGEAEALRKEDFLPDSKVRINKSIYHADGTYKITTPKNESSVRTITIPRQLHEEIVSSFHEAEPWVFSSDGFNPFRDEHSRNAIKKYARLAGVKIIRVHDLRHSCASLLISSGVPITAVSKQLGHANVSMTLNVYAHMMPSDEEKVTNALNAYYSSTQNGANLGQI